MSINKIDQPTITLRLTKAANLKYYGVQSNDTVSIDLEKYLCGVVPSEVYESKTPEEALKAQAIAARTFALRKHMDGVVMNDTTSYQSYTASLADTSPRSAKAVADTCGQVMTYKDAVIQCYYSNSNGGQTKRTDQVWSASLPYYLNRADPWDIAARAQLAAQGKTVSTGHGVGLSQIGAEYASTIGETMASILAFYYPGTGIECAYVDANADASDDDTSTQEEPSMQEYEITVDMHTNNDCYKAARVREKTYVIVHSTAVKGPAYIPRWQQWNVAGLKKCAHAFVDWNGIYQNLPWNYQGWLNGVTAGNDCSVAFEICEPLVKNDTPAMAADLYGKTLYLCTYLCQMFNILPSHVVCHAEAYKLGLANNHSDVTHWWGKKGTSWEQYTMAKLRQDVADALGLTDSYPYEALVVTNSSPLNIWYVATTNTSARKSLGTVKKGDTLLVTGPADLPGWFAVTKGSVSGYSDGQYLQKVEA